MGIVRRSPSLALARPACTTACATARTLAGLAFLAVIVLSNLIGAVKDYRQRLRNAREFAYLDEQRLTYLDFTGAALPAESQLRAHDALLRGQVLGNPHSEHAPSRVASVRIHGARRVGAATAAVAPRLFAYPAQSNFSGVRHPLSLVASAQQLGYTVLLDAAAFVPTSRLDLRRVRPDFVTMSFYKLFGIPTGIGAREPFSPQPGSRERHRDTEVPACGYPPGWSEDARCATVESSSRELPRLAVLCASVPCGERGQHGTRSGERGPRAQLPALR